MRLSEKCLKSNYNPDNLLTSRRTDGGKNTSVIPADANVPK